jgi:hypothetical protein
MEYDEIIARGANAISRRDMLELAYNDPIVHAVLQQWREGLCTFEQALQQAVIGLVAERKSQIAKVMRENLTRPIIVESKVRPEILFFSQEMEHVMAENDKEKGESWKTMSIKELYELQDKQMGLLDIEMNVGHPNPERVRKRLLNIANYCMMIHHRLGEK